MKSVNEMECKRKEWLMLEWNWSLMNQTEDWMGNKESGMKAGECNEQARMALINVN